MGAKAMLGGYYPREGTGLENLSARSARSGFVGLMNEVMVQAGSHLATYYSSDAGRVRIAGPFLRDGIKLGQPSFLIASGNVLESYLEALEKDGEDELAEARRQGLFATAPTPGRTVEEALAFWRERIAAPSTLNAAIVRIVGDMACVKETFSTVAEMLIFERQLGALFTHTPCVAICQYDVREFDGPSLLEAIKAHPDLIDLGLTKFVS